jgi:hypothetical protein
MTGIPQSTALAEASIESLADLMSRDPETHTRDDRDRIVSAMREQRVRLQADERAKPTKAPRTRAPSKLGQAVSASLEDLGIV